MLCLQCSKKTLILKTDFFLYRHAWRYNFSPDKEPHLTDSQCKELLKNDGWLVRNTYDFDQKDESDFWYIIKDSFEGLDELSSNERNKIRRSLKIFDFKIVDLEFVKERAYPIIKSTFDDYKVVDRKMNETVFNEYIEHCKSNNYDYWAAFSKVTGEMVGFCAVNVWKDSCELGLIGFLPEYKHNATYPYYGFFYKLNEYYLGEKKLKYVSDGSRSITEHSNIQPFLIQNFKFRKAYCKLKIHYKWWFGIFVKILFPFRNFIPNKSVKAVLKMHEMRYKGN